MSVIAVFSGPFCAGGVICERLAEHLGFTLIDSDLLVQRASEAQDASADKLARVMRGERKLLSGVTHEHEKSLIYLKAAVADLLADQDVVLYSPAMHLIPRAISHVLRVCVVADEDFRLARAADAGIATAAARAQIEKGDAQLATWTEAVARSQPWDPALYDIKVRLPGKSVDEAVELVAEALAAQSLRPTDLSVGATLDFILAARINLQLLERGHYYCDVTVSGGRVTVVINKPPKKSTLGRVMYGLRLEGLERELTGVAMSNEGVTDVEIRPGPGVRRGPPRALLVDDEEEYVVTLSERLEMRDIDTSVVHDGEQALSFVDDDEPEVMVLDLRMPGIDGLEVLARVKREHPSIEVIVVTGHGSDKDERAARELGAFDYLKKPVNINKLAERMKAASRKARGEEEEPLEDDDD